MAEADNADSVGGVLRSARERLRTAGIDTAGLDARLLAGEVLGLSATELIVADDWPVTRADALRLEAMIARRLAGEPVGRILGRRGFFGLELELSPATLEPRPDTETVVEAALDRVADRGRPIRIVDVGTGSGAIFLAILSALPNAVGLGTDLSPEAAATAARNAMRLGFADRSRVCVCDLASAVAGPVDLFVSNPPYIPSGDIKGLEPAVRDHDPRLALDGGPDGLDAYRRLVAEAARLVAPSGALVLELGVDQARSVADLCRAGGFSVSDVRRDLGGRPRALVATWQ